jgi:hypothetical protein
MDKISLRVTSSGEIPPCTQKKRPSTKAATGRDQKERMQASYTFSEYLCRPRGNLVPINLGLDTKIRYVLTFAFECEIFR